jgi:hypothetical protein
LKSFTTEFSAKPPLHGTWGIDEFVVDGQTKPPLLTDETRWQKAVFDFNTSITLQAMDCKLLRFGAKIDTDKKTIELKKNADPKWKANLNYTFPVPDTMLMDGQVGEQKIHMKLHRLYPKYLLNTRGFHWINEFPFNR